MKHIFIVNRISGKGKAFNFVPQIEKVCKENNLEYCICYTDGPKHAERIASEYHREDNVIIYSVGGDGTLYEIINGLNDGVTVGVLPLGSGNDFSRLIVPQNKEMEILLKTIDAPVKAIDYATCNSSKWINVASFGIDADINADASSWIRKSFLSKGQAYILAIIKNMLGLKAHYYRINIDGQQLEGYYYIVAILNGRYYGNGVPACPDADIQDGLLDLCLVKKQPFYRVYPFLLAYLKGKHLKRPEFIRIKGKRITIDSDELLAFQSDGENSFTKHVEIKIKKGALNIKAPEYYDIIR